MVSEATIATLSLLSVTTSLPFYLYGAWLILDAEVVTWGLLMRHLRYIVVGLLLTTVPVVGWMVPRLPDQFGGLAAVHAFLGLQAYALLAFALTGIVRIFQMKYKADLYQNPGKDVDLDELHPHMSSWRKRLRIGVFGYTLFWIAAYLLGVVRFFYLHVL